MGQKKRRLYSMSAKARIVREINRKRMTSKKSIAELCEAMKMNTANYYRWREEMRNQPRATKRPISDTRTLDVTKDKELIAFFMKHHPDKITVSVSLD